MGMLGHRREGVLELFAAGGGMLSSRFPQGVDALLGLVIHALWMLFWGVLLVSLARNQGGACAALTAIAVAALAFVVATLAPMPSGLFGPIAVLEMRERVLTHVVLALSLVIGMRLAPRVTREAGDQSVPERW